MKVTLELEENDLREMLENYFRQNGFTVKNLDDICGQFAAAYPEGIQVRAEIGPAPVVASPQPDLEPDLEPDAELDIVEELSPRLSIDDLFDPTPRLKRVTAERDTDNDIAKLVRASKGLEKK